MNKRGVSSVIATVLLIGLVVVLSTIVFLWAKGFVKEQIEKFGTPIETQCGNIDFTATLQETNLIVTNRGNIPIYEISFGLKNGGRTEIKNLNDSRVNSGQTIQKIINLTMDKGPAEKIIVYPVLLGEVVGGNENKKNTCLKNGITIEIPD